MALPMDDDFVPLDESSERAPNVDSYRILALISSRIFHTTTLLGWIAISCQRKRIKKDEQK